MIHDKITGLTILSSLSIIVPLHTLCLLAVLAETKLIQLLQGVKRYRMILNLNWFE